jgi:hypothetical protein
MLIDDKDHKVMEETATSRRGFLFGLLGGLAGTAGLSALAAGEKTKSADLASGSGRPVSKPIDNIFTPLPSSKREFKKERS